MILGIVLNLAMLIGMHYINLNSRLTMWLFRSQVIFDGFGCLLTILIFWVHTIPTQDDVIKAVVCNLWYSQAAYWIAIAFSTCNLMCITLDRLLATVYCVTYRIYQTRYVVGCSIATFIYGFSIITPTILLVYYTNGTCETDVRPEFHVAFITANLHRPLWAVVYYFLPLIFLIAVNFRVIWYIRLYYRTHRTSIAPVPELLTTIVNQDLCDLHDDQGITQSRSVIKSLTIGTLTLIATMILAHSYDCGYYVFGPSLGYAYVVGSNEQLISLLITSINCLANPVILALSLPTMRTFIFAQVRKVRWNLKN
ncbi:hypothetical protein PHET_04759 [Paragonimus heterotremus]|uniref:G-protein coupled receptors family 1 profile domain-containing protein n=1 Tax=Paragonimus heterotremus TaxID=100268 RepID=A0A8J4SYN0_9TREM|nr:hypothetical protein PHET_04759 [Paragonimus heterotremus]